MITSCIIRFLTITFFLSSLVAGAQDIQKKYAKAYKTFYDEELTEAFDMFQEIMKVEPTFEEAAYLAEIAYLLTEDRNKPLDRLLFLQTTQGADDKFADYWLGRIYATRYKYDLAISAWNRFLRQKVYLSKEIKAETRKFIKNSKRKLEFFDNPGTYEIKLLDEPVNSQFDDLSPAFFSGQKELLFTSNRSSEEDEVKVFHAIKEGISWVDIREIPKIGDLDRENSTIEVVDQDGKLFVYKKKGGNLFYSSEVDNRWLPLQEFDKKIKRADIESHFFVNDHEDRIIFSSDKGTGPNKLDLFQTFRDPTSGEWSKPAPFSPTVNSVSNEDSPYLSHDETKLYFSSDRPGGIGGYDVYVSLLDTSTLTWSKPKILPFPINTPDDEIHFKVNIDDASGYFSSNRINTVGGYDIFSFKEMFKTRIEGNIFDHLVGGPLKEGRIVFIPLEYEDQYFKSLIDENGHYDMEIYSDEIFRVEIIQDTSVLFVDNFEIHANDDLNTVHIKDFYINKDKVRAKKQKETLSVSDKRDETKAGDKAEKALALDEISTSNNIKISELASKYRRSGKVIIHNIYFDFGTSELTRDSNSVLKELYDVLKSNPDMKVEIAGHTDNVGDKEFNRDLSLRRAKAVRNWLIKKGIDRDRLIANGYGESQPMASNDDEREGRELNRRIEVTLVEK